MSLVTHDRTAGFTTDTEAARRRTERLARDGQLAIRWEFFRGHEIDMLDRVLGQAKANYAINGHAIAVAVDGRSPMVAEVVLLHKGTVRFLAQRCARALIRQGWSREEAAIYAARLTSKAWRAVTAAVQHGSEVGCPLLAGTPNPAIFVDGVEVFRVEPEPEQARALAA